MKKFEVTKDGELWTTHFGTAREAEDYSVSETLKMPMHIFEVSEMENDKVYSGGETIDGIRERWDHPANIMP